MIKIIKNGEVTNIGPDQEWLERHIAMGTFGLAPIYRSDEVLVTPEVRGLVRVLISEEELNQYGEEIKPALYSTDPNGLITPAVYKTVVSLVYAGDYTVEIEDTAAQDALQAASDEALAYLQATDYIVTRASERGESVSDEFRAERDAARAKVIK